MDPRLFSTSQPVPMPPSYANNSASNPAASAHATSSASALASANLPARPNFPSRYTRQYFAGNRRGRLPTPYQTPAFYETLSQESPSLRPRSRPIDPRVRPSGQMLFYLRDPAEVDHTVVLFREQLVGPLGLDIEIKPKFTKGGPQNKTALVQLASDSIVLLVQVSAMSRFPAMIRNIIEDPSIIKAGVGIKGDAEKLWTDFGVSAAGCLELGNFARVVDPPQWAQCYDMIGLARLVKVYEDRDLMKSKKIRLSNWELFLTDAQQDYAADDANAGLTVYHKLNTMLSSVQPTPSEESYIFKMSNGSAITASGNPFPSLLPKRPVVAKLPKDPQAAVSSAASK